METTSRLYPPTSVLGWLVHPLRWVAWRLNKPVFDRLAARSDQLDHVARLAEYTRTHADNIHGLVLDLQRYVERAGPRLDEAAAVAEYTRTHADNILGLVYDTHKRLDALQEHADNVLDVARRAEHHATAARQQVEAEAALRATLVPPMAISPLMAQAITVDHLALTRRIVMLENLLVELQGNAAGEPAVLPLAAAAPRRLAS